MTRHGLELIDAYATGLAVPCIQEGRTGPALIQLGLVEPTQNTYQICNAMLPTGVSIVQP